MVAERQELAVRGQAAMVRQDALGGQEASLAIETSAAAVAAQARAAVEARYKLALARPRDMDLVRLKLMAAAKRPGFAASAEYKKPIGNGAVVGPSIRFAEEALRSLGNVLCETTVVLDDTTKRIIRVSVTDLESNLSFPTDVVVEKQVERSRVREGQEIIGTRTNSQGKQVFIVRATEDDLLNKANALISKAMRGAALRVVPGDIVEEALAVARQTREAQVKADPNAARKSMVDAFAALGVMPPDLKAYLGVELGAASPADLDELRQLYAAIRDGETTWREVMESKRAAAESEKPEEPKAAPGAASAPAKGAAKAKAKLTKQQQPAAEEPPHPADGYGGPVDDNFEPGSNG